VQTKLEHPALKKICPVCGEPAEFAVARCAHDYFACPRCRTLFTPRIDPATIRTENNGHSSRHDPAFDLERLRRLESALGRPALDLVDFGCGAGEFVELMRQKGLRCTGIDQHTKVQLRDLTAGSLDGVTMVEVIEHLYQPHEILRGCHRALRPGGVLYLESSFVDGQTLADWAYLDPAIGHCTLHSSDSMKLLAETHGFDCNRLSANVYVLKKNGEPKPLPAHTDRFHYLPQSMLPVPPDAIPSADFLARTAQSLANFLAGIGPFYLHLGGAGDALLLLATFLDEHPDGQVVSFPNSIPAARSFFEAFPSLRRVWFLPKNTNPNLHLMLRMMMRHVPNCRGTGVTPEVDYFKEWNAQLDIFKKFAVKPRPEWAKRFRTHPHPRQVVLAPQGSLQGMCGSKQNLIHPDVWPELIRFVLDRGFHPVILGTPDERKRYPVIACCEDRRSHSFREQMEWIANSAALIGADSWAKTFSALLGLPTLVFEPLKGADWAGRKDPSDFVFLDPWSCVTVVNNLDACRHTFDRAFSADARMGCAPQSFKFGDGDTRSLPVAVSWIGSFFDHGSLSHVNRQLTAALEALPGIRLQRVAEGVAKRGFEKLPGGISPEPLSDTVVTVRHAWPPEWKRPARGKLVVIQPWEFGALPEQWVKAAANVDEFWVPSEYVRRVYIESGVPAGKVLVVPNGVDLEKFHPRTVPMKLATQKKFKFLFVGGTIFRKGPDLLLKSYLENFTAADDVCLVIKDFGGRNVYAGQTLEAKIRAAQSLPNAPEIFYLNDELPPDALPGLYTACDCLVLPYRGEGFGLPVLEAMACGLPVIVTAGGATDDFVRDEFAWRVPARRMIFGSEISGMKLPVPGWLLKPDAAALGRFLRDASANPGETRRRGQLAAQHAKQFSWQNAAVIAAQRLRELGSKGLEFPDSKRPTAEPPKGGTPDVKVKIILPPCALAGYLGEARELFRQKKFRAAWESALTARTKRPFHPEVFLIFAEIAQAVGDGQSARLCAEHARRIAPRWKPAKKFLNQRLKGGARPEWLQLPEGVQSSKSELQSLSVCLIVKNEEKFLGQCLKSVRGVASQIVVVDTGSTDRTVEIAREHGAEIYSFAWNDDFSAARNAALEHAASDWILMLDADEELSADGREKIKTAMNNAAVMAWRLPIVEMGREAEGCSFVPRLFRNAPGLFYVGRVHEQIFTSVEVRRAEWGLENRLGEAVLIHHGYAPELMRDRNKIERNLRLLERAIAELPDEPHLLMNYGLELARSGRGADALGHYRNAFDILSSKPAAEIVPELRETLLMQLVTRLAAAKRFDEIERVLTSPLAKMNGGLTASLHFSLGLAHIELRRFSEAADQMRRCLAKRRLPCLTPINQEITGAAPHHCLALCLAKSGDAVGAEKAFQEGLHEAGPGHPLRLDYARFLAEQNRPVDALQRLHEIVAANARQVEAWQLGGQVALSRTEFLEFARDWTHEAMHHAPDDLMVMAQRAEALMLSGETAAGAGLWETVWNKSPRPAALAALILCETAESPTTHAPESGDEAATSRAFIAWYRKLIAARTAETVVRINAATDTLSRALPSAAKILQAAIAEANRTNSVCA